MEENKLCSICSHKLTVNGFCRSCNNPSRNPETNRLRSQTITKLYAEGIVMGFRSPKGRECVRKKGAKPTTGTWKRGHKTWNKGLKGEEYSKFFKNGFAHPEGKKGAENPHWKGGITPINTKIRMSKEYKEWRKKVFSRDNYTCIMCQYRGNQLQADHIKPFAYFPELRFEVNNGRTLCKECHKLTDSYLSGALKYRNLNQPTKE